jgi:hypothetical protein
VFDGKPVVHKAHVFEARAEKRQKIQEKGDNIKKEG